MTTYLTLFYAAFPLLFGLFLVRKTDDISKAMLCSVLVGFTLYSVRNCFKAIFAVSGVVSGQRMIRIACDSAFRSVSEGASLIKDIAVDNAAIMTAVFVLFVIVKLVCSSGSLTHINRVADLKVTTRGRYLALFLGLSPFFAIDDYLYCVGVCVVFAAIAERLGIPKEKTAYMTCSAAFAFCTLFSYSSWNPVIRSASGTSVPVASVMFLNMAAYLDIFMVAAEVLSGHNPVYESRNTDYVLTEDAKRAFGILALCVISTGTVLAAVNLRTDGTWSVAAAGTAGSIVLAAAGIGSGMITFRMLVSGILEAFKDTVSLFKMLLLVWLAKSISIEFLGLSDALKAIMMSAAFPAYLIPGIVYAATSGFALMTGTSFGSFSLFIPLGISLAGNAASCLKAATAAAALSGALQSVNRPGSDVVRLVSGVLDDCDEKKLMQLQRKGMLRDFPVLLLSFLIIGLVSNRGTTVMLSVSMAPLIVRTLLFYMHHKESGTEPMMTPAYQNARGIPNVTKYNTFYQKAKELEMMYEVVLISIRQRALEFRPMNSFSMGLYRR